MKFRMKGRTLIWARLWFEQFALDLEPYPHAPDVVLPPGLIMDEDEVERRGVEEESEKKASPFAGLARWRGGNA